MQDDNPAASAAKELKAAARDALRMGSQWAHHAIQWVDERRNEMNNRNREQEERERTQRNRYSTSGYGSDEGDYGPSQYGGSGQQESVGRRGSQSQARGDRDTQGDYSSGSVQQGRHSQSQAPDDFSRRSEYGSQSASGRQQYGQGSQQQYRQQQHSQGAQAYDQGSQQRGWQDDQGTQRYGMQDSRYGSQGYGAGGESYESQDFSQDYSQGGSQFGSQGFGAAGSPGVYGPQGFGSQGARSSSDYERQSGYGAYSREGYGGRAQQDRGYASRSGQWRTSETAGMGLGGQGQYGSQDVDIQGGRSGLSGRSSATGYRGMGPKNYTRSDERIREDLNEKLTDSDEIDASGLSVEVSNGVATLAGTVDQRWMKHRAEDLAESCSGVRDVNNQIRVKSQSEGLRSEGPGSSAASAGSSTTGALGSSSLSGASGGSAGLGAGSLGSTGAQSASGASSAPPGSTGSSSSTTGRSGSTTPRS